MTIGVGSSRCGPQLKGFDWIRIPKRNLINRPGTRYLDLIVANLNRYLPSRLGIFLTHTMRVYSFSVFSFFFHIFPPLFALVVLRTTLVCALVLLLGFGGICSCPDSVSCMDCR